MKYTELRIGNWVTHDGNLIQIELKHFQDILLYPLEIRKYDKVRLTEEWMVKFKAICVESGDHRYYSIEIVNNVYMYLNTHGNSGIVIEEVECECGNLIEDIDIVEEIEYVHTLQNIYQGLNREELETKR